jgi:hypothetical protein
MQGIGFLDPHLDQRSKSSPLEVNREGMMSS